MGSTWLTLKHARIYGCKETCKEEKEAEEKKQVQKQGNPTIPWVAHRRQLAWGVGRQAEAWVFHLLVGSRSLAWKGRGGQRCPRPEGVPQIVWIQCSPCFSASVTAQPELSNNWSRKRMGHVMCTKVSGVPGEVEAEGRKMELLSLSFLSFPLLLCNITPADGPSLASLRSLPPSSSYFQKILPSLILDSSV